MDPTPSETDQHSFHPVHDPLLRSGFGVFDPMAEHLGASCAESSDGRGRDPVDWLIGITKSPKKSLAALALYDGALLAEAIVAHPGNVDAALLAYEQELFPRSAETAAETNKNLKLFFNETAPQGLVDLFTQYLPRQ